MDIVWDVSGLGHGSNHESAPLKALNEVEAFATRVGLSGSVGSQVL